MLTLKIGGRKTGVILVVVGLLVLIAPFLTARLLDDYKLDPYYWVKLENTYPIKKVVDFSLNGYANSKIIFERIEGGNRGFVVVQIFTNGVEVISLGSRGSAFVGLTDVDGDEFPELLFTGSASSSSLRCVWKCEEGKWKEVIETPKARRILDIAELLFLGLLCFPAAFIPCMVGLIMVFDEKQKSSKNS